MIFLLQVIVGATRWLLTGYNFLDEEVPIFITVAEKMFPE